MAVDIAGAIERGLERTTAPEGRKLVAIFVAVAVVIDIAWETVLGRFVRGDSFFAFVPAEVATELRQEWAGRQVLVDVQVPVASFIALVVLLWLFQFVLRIGAKRWFVGEASGQLGISIFTRRVGWTLLNLIAGLILYSLAVAMPPILAVLGGATLAANTRIFVIAGGVIGAIIGVFLAVALYFYTFEVIVAGENAIDALANSYALTAGDRLGLFLVGLVFTLLGATMGIIGVPGILPGRLVPVALGAAATAAFSVFSIATASDLYRQLVHGGAESDDLDSERGSVAEGELAG